MFTLERIKQNKTKGRYICIRRTYCFYYLEARFGYDTDMDMDGYGIDMMA